jgi:hypothetical protein
MTATIASVSPSVRQNTDITITGSGFGAVQGESKVLMLDSEGDIIALTATSWAAGVITATVPESGNIATGEAVVVIQLEGESLGVRSAPDGCEVTAEILPAPVDYEASTFVFLRPGTRSEETPPPFFLNEYSTQFGTSKYAEPASSAPYSLEYTSPFSIGFWIKRDAVIGGGPWTIIGKRSGGATARGYNVEISTDENLVFTLCNTLEVANLIGVSTVATLLTGVWYFVVVTSDGSGLNTGLEVYLNGTIQPVTRFGTLSATIITTPTLWIGGRNSGIGEEAYFPGLVDEVSFFDNDLSGGTVSTMFNSGLPTDLTGMSNLLSWWRMGDGDTHPTIIDHGSAAQNLTMFNMSSGDFSTDVPA